VSVVHASLPVIVTTIVCVALVFNGFFDNNLGVNVGDDEYAEKLLALTGS